MNAPHEPHEPGLRSDRRERVRVVFAGRRCAHRGCDPATALAAIDPASTPSELAGNRQVHSARVVRADSRSQAEADGLWTVKDDLGLVVLTADCVPLLITSGRKLAAVHAGWRGLAAGVIGHTLDQLEEPGLEITAWIGPAMGACCYEVGDDVAMAVAAASGPGVVVPGRRKPHLDLVGAALLQLEGRGVEDIRLLTECTGCASSRWWSHRRGAGRGGRNLAFIWRAGSPAVRDRRPAAGRRQRRRRRPGDVERWP